MPWSRNGSVGWMQNVSWISIAACMALSLSAVNARSETPSLASLPVVAQTDSTLTILKIEYELLLNDRAYLVADLNDCRRKLTLATEAPPECKSGGVPLKEVGLGLLAGVVIGLLLR